MTIKTNNWLVAVACSLIIALNYSFLRVGGLLYIATVERFKVSKSQASLPYFWCNLIKSLAGPLVGCLSESYGSSEVTMAGTLVSALGVGMCYFVEHITVLIILWGGILGFGVAMSSAMIGDILNDHFDKNHITTASGISLGGAGIGSVILVYFCDFLLNQYNLSDTFLILSGFMLNGLPLGMILIYSKATDGVVNEKRFPGTLDDRDQNIDANESGGFSLTFNNESSSRSNSGVEIDGISTDNVLTKEPLRESSPNLSVNIKNVEKHLSKHYFENQEENNSALAEKPLNAVDNNSKLTKNKILQNIILRFRIFWNPTFLVICINQSSLVFIGHTLLTIIIDAAKDKEVGPGLEIYCLSCLLIADTIGRLGLGWVTDCNFLTNVNFSALSFACLGISLVAIALLTSFSELIIALSIFGILGGAIMVVFTGIVCEFIEKDQLKMAMSARPFLSAPMFLTAGPMIMRNMSLHEFYPPQREIEQKTAIVQSNPPNHLPPSSPKISQRPPWASGKVSTSGRIFTNPTLIELRQEISQYYWLRGAVTSFSALARSVWQSLQNKSRLNKIAT
ncbi:hypothetical protein AVEN_227164-1 [Araneus ventricosus]|uniref:Uncharacterized protein n=1 Tax=Araneus ventricosus TaxID=182803 RepID=A0A4Y2BUK0_ARAVE|nr:hypothetical protein AVEN_227164-1 [Araneus ventricosus]